MIKNLALVFVFIFCQSFAFSQMIKFDTITIGNHFIINSNEDDRVPIFKLGDEKTDSILNNEVLSFIDWDEDSTEELDSLATQWLEDYKASCDYEITFLKKGILSFNLYLANAFGNPNGTIYRYNYSYKTGESLEFEDVIDSTSIFYKKIQDDLLENLEKEYPADLADSTNANFDQYNGCWEPGYYEGCKLNLNTKNFAVTESGLEIFNNFEIRQDCRLQSIFLVKKYSWEEIGEAFIKEK